jgi:hypothetical protein
MTSLAGTAAPLMTQVDTGQGRAITNARIAAEAQRNLRMVVLDLLPESADVDQMDARARAKCRGARLVLGVQIRAAATVGVTAVPQLRPIGPVHDETRLSVRGVSRFDDLRTEGLEAAFKRIGGLTAAFALQQNVVPALSQQVLGAPSFQRISKLAPAGASRVISNFSGS